MQVKSLTARILALVSLSRLSAEMQTQQRVCVLTRGMISRSRRSPRPPTLSTHTVRPVEWYYRQLRTAVFYARTAS